METAGPKSDLTTHLKQAGPRACGTCVKAKVKCVPNPGRGKCQRCHRLDKICLPSAPSTRKRPQSAQVAQLEKKLDNLVNLLTMPKDANIPAPNTTANPPTLPAPTHPVYSTPTISEDEAALGPGKTSQPVFLACSGNRPQSGDSWSSIKNPFDFDLEGQEAAFLLIEFRTQMAHHFPFVIIPPDATSESLRPFAKKNRYYGKLS